MLSVGRAARTELLGAVHAAAYTHRCSRVAYATGVRRSPPGDGCSRAASRYDCVRLLPPSTTGPVGTATTPALQAVSLPCPTRSADGALLFYLRG